MNVAEPLLKKSGSPVARKKAVSTVQVRVAKDVAETAAIVAAYRRMQASDLLTEILRPVLKEMHRKHIAAAADRGYPPPPSGPGSEPSGGGGAAGPKPKGGAK